MIGGCALVLLLCTVAITEGADEPSKEIPLDQIWAWKMPGTKNAGTLDATKIGLSTHHPIIGDILSVLVHRRRRDEKAGPAFVVEGVGKEALHNAHSIFTKETTSRDEMPADTELSLVFYSHNCGQWVHVVSVEKSENVITVKYRFVAHATASNSNHFALIPIGKLPPGVVEVKIEQQNAISQFGAERSPIPKLERLVSKSFSFNVRK